MKTREVERIALTEGELKAMAEKDFPIERLPYVRDIFLFCCYTGLSFIDAIKLTWSDILVGIDGPSKYFALSKLIEAGLLSDQKQFEDDIINGLQEGSLEEFKSIHTRFLQLGYLIEFYNHIKTL